MQSPSKRAFAPVLALTLCCLTLLTAPLRPALAQSEEDLALLDRSAKAFSSVVKKAGPAVVHVAVEKPAKSMGQFPSELFSDPFFERFFGPQFRHPRVPDREKRNFRQQAAGSGFIIASDGHILTNNHVVEGAEKITVRLADQREFTAKVVGTDPQSDVAIIKIDGSNLPVLPLGNSDALEVGEWVIAIGSPFELNQTVTVGVVSAKGRNRMGINDYENFIQTDAAINPGNSGGALTDVHGNLMGINTAIYSRSGGNLGIGFAIPVSTAKQVMESIVKNGQVVRGWIGVEPAELTPELAQTFGIRTDQGVIITGVLTNGPAAQAGIRPGDVITEVGGQPVRSVSELLTRITALTPGQTTPFVVQRRGESVQASVTPVQRPRPRALQR